MRQIKKYGSRIALWLLAACVSLNAQAEQYLPIEFINATKIARPDQIHILVTAKTPDTLAPCFVKFNNGTGVCTPLTNTTKSAQFVIALSQLPNSTLNIPKVASGRIYVSIGQPVDMYVTPNKEGVLSIIEPDGFKLRDSNYYVLYDKFEFSYVDQGLWVNPTAVDFLSLPISFNHPYATGFKQVGLSLPQKEVIHKIATVFDSKTEDPTAVWKKSLFIEYPAGNVLRVVSPGKAIVEDPLSQLNPGHYFPQKYLMSPTSYNYTQALWDFYADGKGNEIAIDLHELPQYRHLERNDPKTIFKGTTKGDKFVFTNGTDTFQIGMPSVSNSFYGGAGGPFDAANNTPEAVVVRQLTSAFEIGALPRAGQTLLQFKDEQGNKITCAKLKEIYESIYPAVESMCSSKQEVFPYYQTNSAWNGSGPWYDLYSKALHSIHAESNPQPIYTFAYDDALAQDGTIHVLPEYVNQGTLKVTLGDLTGVTIPEFEKEGTEYSGVFIEAGAGNIVTYTKTNGQGKLIGGGPEGVDPDAMIKIPFVANYCDEHGERQTAKIYMKPAMVRPYAEGADGIAIKNSDPVRSNRPSIIFPGLPTGVSCKNNVEVR